MRSFFLFTALLTVHSCKNPSEPIEKSDYKFFDTEQHGWKSKRINLNINDIDYTATEVPLRYYLEKNNDKENTDSTVHAHAEERIIEWTFQHDSREDILSEKYTHMPFDDAVKYMAFTIEKDFTLITSAKDTIPCVGVNFERSFKLTPFKRILLYFDGVHPDDKVKLIYHDQLFGNGTLEFVFDEIPLAL